MTRISTHVTGSMWPFLADSIQCTAGEEVLHSGLLNFWTSIATLVIIGGEALAGAGTISRLSRNGRMLHALSVSWNNGIALRNGFVSIPEENWIGLKNRKWRLVALR